MRIAETLNCSWEENVLSEFLPSKVRLQAGVLRVMHCLLVLIKEGKEAKA